MPSPLLLRAVPHRPRPTPDWADVRVVAHRGDSGTAPENTHAAFDRAADAGFALELDVGLSADGTPWVMHDDTVDRTTGRRGFLDRLPDAELRLLDAGAWHGTPGEPIPTLDEVLERHGRRVPLDIEIKRARPGGTHTAQDLGRVVAARIADHGLQDDVVVTSFDPYVLEAVRLHEPAIRRGQLISTFEGSGLGPITRLALKHLWLDGRVHADLVVIEDAQGTPAFVSALKQHGFRVWAYTVDDPVRARALMALGVDAIITNEPGRIAEAL